MASLARTHTAYQREAEQALYRTVSYPSLKCLETLSRNSEKAGFVRFFTMEFVHRRRQNDDSSWRSIDYLLNALVNMHFLSDFRVRMPHYEIDPWVERVMESLEKIMWSVYELLEVLIF